MKKGIHPQKKKIGIIMTDGAFFQSIAVSTYHVQLLKLDIDSKKHPCWNTHMGTKGIDIGNRLQKFKNKYN